MNQSSDPAIDAEIIRRNIARLRADIDSISQQHGRDPNTVCLVGVTKYVDTDTTRLVAEAGLLDLGESRPQQLWEKAAALAEFNPRWHLVGHLQRNKIRRTLPHLHLVHSLDSQRLLKELDREAARVESRISGLLEINLSQDSTKTGLSLDQAHRLLTEHESYPHVAIRGLMTMASRDGDALQARREFAKLRETRDIWQQEFGNAIDLSELSMGMSGDYAQAIAEGATLIRVGSTLLEGVRG